MVFAKTRMAGYPAAVMAARNADRYGEATIASKLLHFAGFGTSRDQFARALFVLKEMRTSKTFRVYAGGRFIQDSWRIEETLECALAASACADPRAHCVVMLHDEDIIARPRSRPISIQISVGAAPAAEDRFGLWKVGQREFLCRHLYERGFKLQPDHPASEDAQIQAGAVRFGCDWCPHFRQIGTLLPPPDILKRP